MHTLDIPTFYSKYPTLYVFPDLINVGMGYAWYIFEYVYSKLDLFHSIPIFTCW